jgi:hypothetical protein
VGDLLWKARWKTLAVVILQQGFPTQLSGKKARAMNVIFSCAESIYRQLRGSQLRYTSAKLQANSKECNYIDGYLSALYIIINISISLIQSSAIVL